MGKKGAGGGIFKEAERGIRDSFRKWSQNPLEATGDLFVRGMTADLLKMEDGKLSEGNAFHRFDEIVGEFSGRNNARAAGYETEKQIREAEDLTKKMREDDLLNKYRTDLNASRGAEAMRASSAARSASTDRSSRSKAPLGAEDGMDLLGV